LNDVIFNKEATIIALKILIASESFNDVYSPMQACEMNSDVIKSLQLDNISVETIPMADGGEYSNKVLLNALNCKKNC
jgi:glycerate kinase